MDDFDGEIFVDGSIFVLSGHRVYQITAWRQTEHGGPIITIAPGSPDMQMFWWGKTAFHSKRAALLACLDDIDHMRRFFDDLAERTQRSLRAIDFAESAKGNH